MKITLKEGAFKPGIPTAFITLIVAGLLTVGSLLSSGTITAPNFVATSTSAVNTLPLVGWTSATGMNINVSGLFSVSAGAPTSTFQNTSAGTSTVTGLLVSNAGTTNATAIQLGAANNGITTQVNGTTWQVIAGGVSVLSFTSSDAIANLRVRPVAQNAQDLGASTQSWKDVYVSSTLHIGNAGNGIILEGQAVPQFTMSPFSGTVADWRTSSGSDRYIQLRNSIESPNTKLGLYVEGAIFATTTGIIATDATTTNATTTAFAMSYGTVVSSTGALGSGLTFFNTTDTQTNTEFVKMGFSNSTNFFDIVSGQAGGGTSRALRLIQGGASNGNLALNMSGGRAGLFTFSRGTSGSGIEVVTVSGAQTQPSGHYGGLSVQPTINQSGSADYALIQASSTETTVGSGEHLLYVGSVNQSRVFSVDNGGNVTTTGSVSSTAFVASTGTVTSVSYAVGQPNNGFYTAVAGQIAVSIVGAKVMTWNGTNAIFSENVLPDTTAGAGTRSLGRADFMWGDEFMTRQGYATATNAGWTMSNSTTTNSTSTGNFAFANPATAGTGFQPACFSSTGNFVGIGTASICPLSALSAKTDLANPSYGLAEILRTSFYDWKFKDGRDNMTHESAIADYIQPYMPNIVTRDKDGKITGIDQFSMIGVDGQAIKDLNAKFEAKFNAQQKEIDSLKADKAANDARFAKIEAQQAKDTSLVEKLVRWFLSMLDVTEKGYLNFHRGNMIPFSQFKN